MHTWYKAVCYEHKEFIDIFVNTPSRTAHLLSEWDGQIYEWLGKHCGCDIHMVKENTEAEEKLFDGTFRSVSHEWKYDFLWPPEYYKNIGVNSLREMKKYDEDNGYYDGFYYGIE